MPKMRVHRWMAMVGLCSRREAEARIRQGRVTLNGEVIKGLAQMADTDHDRLVVDGKPVRDKVPPFVYWMLNKPRKFLIQRAAEGDSPTVYDLPKLRKVKFPVWPLYRMDFFSEGMLVMTNDGELLDQAMTSKGDATRRYQLLVPRRLTKIEENALKKGVEVDREMCKLNKIQFVHDEFLGKSRGSWYLIEIDSDKKKIVQDMLEAQRIRAVRLVLIGLGDVTITPDVKEGDYKQMSPKEIKQLRALYRHSGDKKSTDEMED